MARPSRATKTYLHRGSGKFTLCAMSYVESITRSDFVARKHRCACRHPAGRPCDSKLDASKAAPSARVGGSTQRSRNGPAGQRACGPTGQPCGKMDDPRGPKRQKAFKVLGGNSGTGLTVPCACVFTGHQGASRLPSRSRRTFPAGLRVGPALGQGPAPGRRTGKSPSFFNLSFRAKRGSKMTKTLNKKKKRN